MRRTAWVVLVAVFGPAAQSVRAQEESERYGARARTTRSSFEHARATSETDRARAEQTAARDVGDALEQADMVVVQRTSSGSAVPIVRGLTGYQVLLMLDDLRLNDALTRAGGGATLNLIDPESIERVEVIRGPASVLYGSDALGGVVHVRTLNAGAHTDAEPAASATAYARCASAERALRVSGAVQGVVGPFAGRLSGGRGYAGETLRGGSLGEQPYTGHEDFTLASRLEAVPRRGHLVTLGHQSGHLFDMPRSDASTPEDLQRTATLDRDSGVLTYTGRLMDGRVRLRAFAGMTLRREHRERFRDGGEEHERERVLGYQVGARASFAPWEAASLELGAESSIERISSAGEETDAAGMTIRGRGRYVDRSAYDMHAIYGLLSQGLGERLTLLVGARGTGVFASAPADPLFSSLAGADATLDRSFFGAIGSVGTTYALSPELRWVTSLVGGFRAPNLEDFQAFGGGARGFTVPNSELDEERSWTLESGLELNAEHWQAEGFVFGSLLSGLIVRVPTTLDGMTMIDGEPVLARRNASDGVLVGGELGVTHHFELGLFAGGSVWLTWGEVTRPGELGGEVKEPANKVPPPAGALRVGYSKASSPLFAESVLKLELPQSRLSESDLSDVRLCPDGPEVCDEVPGHAELTLRAGLRYAQVSITLALENALDTAYRTYASGAYAPGRNFVLGVRGRL